MADPHPGKPQFRPLDPATREAIAEYVDSRQLDAEEPPAELVARLETGRQPAFRDTLLSMIRERGAVDSRVCAAAGIDRRHYSKIRNSPDWRPGKATAVSFALALKLDLREAETLLRSAGYAFSKASEFDLICSYFIEHRIWDSTAVNEALYAFGQPLVCGATA